MKYKDNNFSKFQDRQRDGIESHYSVKSDRQVRREQGFFSLHNYKMFSKRLTTDDKHSIIEKELVELVWTLKEGEDYSYDEVITPLLRAAKLKNIGI